MGSNSSLRNLKFNSKADYCINISQWDNVKFCAGTYTYLDWSSRECQGPARYRTLMITATYWKIHAVVESRLGIVPSHRRHLVGSQHWTCKQQCRVCHEHVTYQLNNTIMKSQEIKEVMTTTHVPHTYMYSCLNNLNALVPYTWDFLLHVLLY